ncbi:hypothetical protein D3218_12980 [Aureimonas flava]|uniref:Uncharacterized protein n=1 Tax=Aureimonas flava TaxID=2320271 RepID=A0A3A1WS91_9HYPH|nr:hypothetical protein [Aureimonas flava]RIY00195.1 hypothetical protein D3218_12980 [Aureimonas flava]
MSALHELLARAEQNEAARAAELANLAASRALLKSAEDEARSDYRKAHGVVIRIRGAIEAVERLPEAAEILGNDPAPATADSVLDGLGLRAGQEGEPPLVEVAPVAPFTPALDYRVEHPVEPPRREPNVRPIAATSAIKAIISRPVPVARAVPESSRPARPNAKKVRALADEILAMFQKVRQGRCASLDTETIYRDTGKSANAVSVAPTDLAERGLIRRVKAAERGHITILMMGAAEAAE